MPGVAVVPASNPEAGIRGRILVHTALVRLVPQVLPDADPISVLIGTCRHHVGEQAMGCAWLSGIRRMRDHHCLAHRRVPRKGRLDLTQLDAESIDLYLVVDAAQVFKRAIAALPNEIARPVHAAASLERIGKEALGRQVRAVKVAPHHAVTTDIQLAGRFPRDRMALLVKHIDERIPDRPSNRRRCAAGDRRRRRPDRCLCGAVHVQDPAASNSSQALGKIRRKRLPTEEQGVEARHGGKGVGIVGKRARDRGSALEMGDAAAADQRRDATSLLGRCRCDR